jgi:hypothetical protein
MKRRLSVLLLIATLVCSSFSSTAQNVAAYSDYRSYFHVFDHGVFQQLEYLPVKSFKVGGVAVPYVDNTNEFRIYWNGQKYYQTYASDLTYYVSDYLVAFRIGQVLSVFEKGRSKKLTYFCSQVFLSDSLVVYFDDSNYNLGVYYNGEQTELESSMLELPRAIKIGSNMVGFVNQSNYFKLFYKGQIIDVDNVAPVTFDVGRDIAAYVDGYNNIFHLFYKGETAQIENTAPESFKLGFGTMAYVDYQGSFRVFSNGTSRRLLSNRPDMYAVKGNIIVYTFNNEFRIFQNGESKLVDDTTPTEYKLGNNGVAYINTSNHLKYYSKGKSYVVSFEPVSKYYINNDVIWYLVGVNTWKVFSNGINY